MTSEKASKFILSAMKTNENLKSGRWVVYGKILVDKFGEDTVPRRGYDVSSKELSDQLKELAIDDLNWQFSNEIDVLFVTKNDIKMPVASKVN